MKSLIISVSALAVLLGGWSLFMHFSDQSIHRTAALLDNEVLPAVLQEDWEQADKSFAAASDLWMSNKISYLLFTNSRRVEETELTFHRLKGCLSCRDMASAAEEASALKRQLLFLHEYEIISIENVI